MMFPGENLSNTHAQIFNITFTLQRRGTPVVVVIDRAYENARRG